MALKPVETPTEDTVSKALMTTFGRPVELKVIVPGYMPGIKLLPFALTEASSDVPASVASPEVGATVSQLFRDDTELTENETGPPVEVTVIACGVADDATPGWAVNDRLVGLAVSVVPCASAVSAQPTTTSEVIAKIESRFPKRFNVISLIKPRFNVAFETQPCKWLSIVKIGNDWS